MLKTKKQFMKHLVRQLKWRCPRKEYQEIVNDYETFFNDGFIQGKSESELCEDFGNPKDIIASLDDELKFKPSLLQYCQNYMLNEVSIYNFIYVAIAIFILETPFTKLKAITISIFGLAVLLALLKRLSRNESNFDYDKRKNAKSTKSLPLALYMISTIITLIIFFTLTQLVKGQTLNIPFGINQNRIGPITENILSGLITLQLISMLLVYFFVKSWQSFFRNALIQYYGVILSCLLITNHLHWLNDISEYSIGIQLSLLPFISSLIVLYSIHLFRMPIAFKGD